MNPGTAQTPSTQSAAVLEVHLLIRSHLTPAIEISATGAPHLHVLVAFSMAGCLWLNQVSPLNR